jgi:flagellar hook-associated protein 1 FlgK
MSLMGALRMASNTLRIDQIGVEVAGQNIANANTPGYIREEVLLTPAPMQRIGGLLMGMGAEVKGIVQKIDNFLEDRLRGAVSERANGQAQTETYQQLEQLVNGLSETDLASSMNEFFASISDVLNQQESVSVRNLAVLQGETLTSDIQRMANRAIELRNGVNERVEDMGERVNRLTEEIARLNVRIAESEGGNTSSSDAVGLRDQRLNALTDLASLISIRVEEQESGGVVVYCGGDFLVYEGTQRPVKVTHESVDGLASASVHLEETDSPLELNGGELLGLTKARDEILGGFINNLDEFARTFAFEFNKIFSGGQGLTGYREATSEFAVDDETVALNSALSGLEYTPGNGFQIVVRNTKTGVAKTTDVKVNLTGLGEQTTLTSLIADLNQIPGLEAKSVNGGHLELKASSADEEFSFANDTSGVLAALGINTFFSGSSTLDMGVSKVLQKDPGKFAASRGGIGADTSNAIVLANFIDEPLASRDGNTISVLYDQLTADVTQGAAIAKASFEGASVFEQTLSAQKSATSGVNLDEEAINLMSYQHSYQASARFIKTIQEMLNLLMSI